MRGKARHSLPELLKLERTEGRTRWKQPVQLDVTQRHVSLVLAIYLVTGAGEVLSGV
jgi:hypothetical protein